MCLWTSTPASCKRHSHFQWLSRTLAALEIGLGTFGQGLACSKPPNESRQKGALARECWRLRADILTRGPGDWRGPMPVLPSAMANRRTTSRKGCQTNRCRLCQGIQLPMPYAHFTGVPQGVASHTRHLKRNAAISHLQGSSKKKSCALQLSSASNHLLRTRHSSSLSSQ